MRKLLLLFGIITLFFMQSCYYDNMEELYPDNGANCDTINVTYSQTIWPIIQSNCTGCHSGSAPSGNIQLENYSNVVTMIENGKLMGTIRFESGFSAMPKGGNKLSDCNIAKLDIWIKGGYPEN